MARASLAKSRRRSMQNIHRAQDSHPTDTASLSPPQEIPGYCSLFSGGNCRAAASHFYCCQAFKICCAQLATITPRFVQLAIVALQKWACFAVERSSVLALFCTFCFTSHNGLDCRFSSIPNNLINSFSSTPICPVKPCLSAHDHITRITLQQASRQLLAVYNKLYTLDCASSKYITFGAFRISWAPFWQIFLK